MKRANTSEKNLMKQQIKDCLINGNYQHEFAKLTNNSINTLKLNDLVCVYKLIITKIMETTSETTNTRTIVRPICPIISPEKINQAKADYKLSMIAYLAQFGIYLTENAPCNYAPALLESLANYCEKIVK